MIVLYALTGAALAASLVGSRGKTLGALRMAGVRLVKTLPAFLTMLVLFSVAITLAPQETLRTVLGREGGWLSVALAAAIGSVTLMPGFIAFPLSGALRAQGVPYMVLGAFTTTLMMVGVLTYPLESRYFGRNVTLIRNAISLAIALAVSLVMGLVFGEVRW